MELAESPRAADLTGATLLSDGELVTQAREGDRRAFGTLYLRHHDAAWRVACTTAASNADAEDAVAEGFAKVFAALPRMVDRDLAFRPYLLACVRNSAVDRHRREKKVDLRDDVPEQAAVLGDPDEIVLADLERNLVGEALRTLPERWRTVLWLTEVEGMTPTEVSAVIGIKPNAVAALSYRAREGLREAYLQAHLRAEARAACRYTVDRLGPYVRGELAERERVRVQAHLDECSTCRQRRDELADVNASLLGALVPVPLLLGAKAQQAWLAAAHLGKGALIARAPVKAAKVAAMAGSSSVHAGLAGMVATLLVISTGIAVDRSQSGVEAPRPQIAAPAPLTIDTASEVTAVPEAPPEGAADALAADEAGGEVAAAPRALRTPRSAASAAPEQGASAHQSDSAQSAPPPAPPEPSESPAPPPSSPPPPPPPPPPALAEAKASVGQGITGAALGATLQPGNPQPDLDLTVGNTQVLGDAPPAQGTNASVGGSLVPQPPLDAPVAERAPPGPIGSIG
jgi:RNA polymerase sigma factor (sigma-70 family)